MSELPEELLEEILCRVPAASLKHLRSTCKRWNRLFNDSIFARKHSDRANKLSLILKFKKSRLYSIIRINLHRFSPEKLIGQLRNRTELHYSLGQTITCGVSHCDGLLLCLTNIGLVVWNPCTGQNRWIACHEEHATYALGSYQDKISNSNSYKILSQRGYGDNKEYKICDIYSNSWRILDVTIDFNILGNLDSGVSLKGKTYLIARDEKELHLGPFLVSFDYTAERFERLCLPHQHENVSLSVVREEKLSVLLQRDSTSKTEIYVTNKIGDETKVVSWSMVFAVDLGPELATWHGGSFWIDEEKKVLVYCDNLPYKKRKKVHIVGEDNKVEQVLVVGSFLFNYVPSLIQIKQGIQRKRRRRE